MNQNIIDATIRAATRIAVERGIDIDQAALVRAVLTVTGKRTSLRKLPKTPWSY
jgi:hypothetical protein